jgi:hypothetical protein
VRRYQHHRPSRRPLSRCLQRSAARFSVFAGAGYIGAGILAAHQELVCRAVRLADGGDHLIIIGAPVDGEVTGDRPPLVFFGRGAP